MRFLCIAERELRAGARQKRTHHLRWITAAVFFALLIWLMWVFEGVREPQIFKVFSAMTLLYCILIGTAGTADCLSSEKREGTMGLLFLTNLNGPEIIGGKLCSSALTAAYGLFAIFPLLALQMLIGGITLGHFWKTVLSLVTAIFFSVATGFLASSVCVRQFTAIALATGLALLFSAGLMGVAAVARAFGSAKSWVDGLAIFSPLYSFISADRRGAFGWNYYWSSIFAVTGVSWLFLTLATLQVSLSWRDRPTGTRTWRNFKGLQNWRQEGKAGRAALRRRLLGINPFFWLGGRRVVSSPVFMLLTVIIVVCAAWVAAPYFGRTIRAGTFSAMVGHLFAWVWAGLAVHALVLYYGAMAASQRLAEDKQTGALELVLSTPASVRSISRGLWMAYGRRMFFPAIIAILMHFFVIWQAAILFVLDPPSPKLPPGTTPGELLWHALLNHPIGGVPLEWGFILALRIVVLALVLLMLVWFSLGWVGRWLGLRMKHPGFAPMTSLALMVAPPILLFSLACYATDKWHFDRLPSHRFVPIMAWVAFGIGAGHCLMLSVWAAGRLRRDFLTVVTSRYQPAPLRPWWRPTRRKWLLIGLGTVTAGAALLIIILSFYGYQNWRSQRAWSEFQKGLKQRNESLDVAPLLPGPVPENQNFALTPAFRSWVNPTGADTDAATKQLFDHLRQLDPQYANISAGIEWTLQGFAFMAEYADWIAPEAPLPRNASRSRLADAVLQGLKPHDATIRALATGARLPHFQTFTNRDARAVLHPAREDNAALERLHLLFQARACALLATNRNGEAAEDFLTGLQLVRLSRQIPDAKSSLRTQTMLTRSLQPLWEGIVERHWTAAQLAAFQDELSVFNLLVDHTNAIRRVVLANIGMWREMAHRKSRRVQLPAGQRYRDDPVLEMQPRAWWFENCMQLYEAGENAIQKVDVAGAHVRNDRDGADFSGLALDNETASLLQPPWWSGASPALVVFAQTAVNQAIIACALERFRLATGHYPETLEQLIPEYLRSIPNDVVRGRPMLYENIGDGHFVLRSVGPNEVDDRKKPVSDDWLWSFPTNAPATQTSRVKRSK